MQEMLVALKDVMSRAEMFAHHHVQRERLSVRQRMSDVLDALRTQAFVEFAQLFRPEEGRMGVTVTFVAILELLREGLIEIVQAEQFAPIHVRAGAPRHVDARRRQRPARGRQPDGIMSDHPLCNVVEAVLLAAGRPVTVEQMLELFDEHERPAAEDMRAALADLAAALRRHAASSCARSPAAGACRCGRSMRTSCRGSGRSGRAATRARCSRRWR